MKGQHIFALRILLLLATVVFAQNVWAQAADLSEIGTDSRRTLFVSALIRMDGTAEPVEAFVSDFPPGTSIADPAQIRLEYLDAGDQVIGQRNAWDPRWEFYETDESGEAQRTLDEAIGEFGFPFDSRIFSVRITDLQDELELLTIDVSSVVLQFCLDNPDDPNCADVPSPNQPPVADAGGPYSVEEDASLTLDGSGSSDPDGDALTFKWDLDGDGAYGESSPQAERGDESGETPEFLASGLVAPDSFTVSLQVCDPSGDCDVDSTQIQVTVADADADGVPDRDDVCPQTVELAPTSGTLKPNRWRLAEAGAIFEQAPPQAQTGSITIQDTGGCSCSQIAEGLGAGKSHTLDGCSSSLLAQWIDEVTSGDH
jgi:hypothetical protein